MLSATWGLVVLAGCSAYFTVPEWHSPDEPASPLFLTTPPSLQPTTPPPLPRSSPLPPEIQPTPHFIEQRIRNLTDIFGALLRVDSERSDGQKTSIPPFDLRDLKDLLDAIDKVNHTAAQLLGDTKNVPTSESISNSRQYILQVQEELVPASAQPFEETDAVTQPEGSEGMGNEVVAQPEGSEGMGNEVAAQPGDGSQEMVEEANDAVLPTERGVAVLPTNSSSSTASSPSATPPSNPLSLHQPPPTEPCPLEAGSTMLAILLPAPQLELHGRSEELTGLIGLVRSGMGESEGKDEEMDLLLFLTLILFPDIEMEESTFLSKVVAGVQCALRDCTRAMPTLTTTPRPLRETSIIRKARASACLCPPGFIPLQM